MVRRYARWMAALVLVIGWANAAGAQDVSSDWADATSQMRAGDVVRVTETGGRAFEWKLAEIPIDNLIAQAGLA